MNKAILIFVALFALASANFKTLPLEQGGRLRNLAVTGTPQYSFDNYTTNFGVRVNLSSTYLTSIGLDNNTQTDMLVYLYSNATGFCESCSQFVNFGCYSNNCSRDTSSPQSTLNPNYYVITGYPFNFSNLTIGSDSTNSPWKLSTTALLNTYYSSNSIWTPGNNQATHRNSSTYGFIGLGVGGNASKNFQTANPIFSININGSGSGSLIFGKDSTLIDSKRTPITLTTDTNWTMTTRNMSLGPLINNTDYNTNLIFDIQTPCVTFSDQYWSSMWSTFISKYNLTYNSSTYGNTDFPYTYAGALSNLPTLIFGMTNNKNITLPPSAYTRKLADNFYSILFGNVGRVNNQTSNQYVNFTVLGWPVLSQFYTVFELPASGIPTVTMNPTYNASANGVVDNSSSSSFSLKTLAIVAAVVLVVLVALSAVCKKKNEFTKSDLGVELRAARV